MFDRQKRNGLASRLMKRVGLPQNAMTVNVIAPIAMANYPKGAELPILPPQVDEPAIWKATEAYVDQGVGTLDDLYRAIWGVDLDGYVVQWGERFDPN